MSRHLISGLRASVPVPEQGTSARTRSNFVAKGNSARRRQPRGYCWVPAPVCRIVCAEQFPQQACAVRMKLDGSNSALRLRSAMASSLSPGSRTTIENAARRGRQELRRAARLRPE